MEYAAAQSVEVLRYKPEIAEEIMRGSLGFFFEVILLGSTQHGCLLEVRVAGA
jgi:hypothetical protein